MVSLVEGAKGVTELLASVIPILCSTETFFFRLSPDWHDSNGLSTMQHWRTQDSRGKQWLTSTSGTLWKQYLLLPMNLDHIFFLRITSSFSMSSIGKNPHYQTVLFFTTLTTIILNNSKRTEQWNGQIFSCCFDKFQRHIQILKRHFIIVSTECWSNPEHITVIWNLGLWIVIRTSLLRSIFNY